MTTDDHVELRRLVERYGFVVDDRDEAGYARLYAPGGRFVVYAFDSAEPTAVYEGETLREVIRVIDPYLHTMHFVGNHVCELDGDRATGDTYCIAHHHREGSLGESFMTLHVRYRDAYVRTAEGWRFEERICRLLWKESGPLRFAPAAWPEPALDTETTGGR